MKKAYNKFANFRAESPYHTALLFALFGFVFTFTISSVFSRSMQDQNMRDFTSHVKQQAMSIQTHVTNSSHSYDQLLFSAASLFAVKQNVTREDWSILYQSTNIAATYPELIGVGYAPLVSSSDADAFQERIRSSGITDFTITSPASHATSTPILYLEPSNDANMAAIGYDMYSDPVRRAAMEQARDNAEAVMTAPVGLAQDRTNKNAQQGVLVYYPVYSSTLAPNSLESRRSDIRGYVYIVLHPSDLIKQYIDKHADEYALTSISVEDITDTAHVSKIFSISPPNTTAKTAITDQEESTISGRTWRISACGWISVIQRLSPFVVFALGTVVSLLLAWAIYRATMGKLRHLETTYEGEVQRTKDELLALASHQLRTPASGVKQYIGILTSGLFGELNADQKSIAQKAYDANERQLEIINELLYVSKADAGQLVIEPKSFDMTRLVQRSADNLNEQAAHKNITILFPTKREHKVTGDDRYIAMAIDNLISNAIKYSYPSSTIRLQVTRVKDGVKFTIRDKGVGIAEDDKELIFGKFNRADNPLSHSEGGSGLGLFLARQLARAHGGDITVSSVLEKGSVFTLTLPKNLTINEAIVNLERVKKNEEEYD